ncbi:MAG: branched-chain amino acid ABC transporter permease [Desulfarculaceae bacterium]|nr:branched-chain amino acid ABC transporter permease [Desulfarculaceae bacterium]
MAAKPQIKTWSVAALLALLLAGPLLVGNYYQHLALLTFIYIILTSSLRTIYISGQLSLGHASFMAIGAYVSAILAKNLAMSPWLCIPLGGLAAALVGAGIGFPFSRLRAIYFSMASLFFGIMVTSSVGLAPKLTGSYTGLFGIPKLFGYSKAPYYYFFLLLMLACLWVMHRVECSRLGLTFKCVAQAHRAASSRGVNEAGMRILAICLGSFFAGVAGAGYAHYAGFVAPDTFGVMPSILLIVYLLAGGKSSFAGPIVGTAILYLIPYVMGGFEGYAPFFQAAALIAVVFFIPQGMISLPGQVRTWLRERGQ